MTPSKKGVTIDFCEKCSVKNAVWMLPSVMFYQIQYKLTSILITM